MKRNGLFLFGPLAAAILAASVVALGSMIAGYSPVQQTVSEIGEVGSPMQAVFTISLCAVAACLLLFALGLGRVVKQAGGRGAVGAWLVAFMAVPVAGVGVFSFPHPLHNVFGMLELIGYLAPLAFALGWQGRPATRGLAGLCWVAAVLVILSVAANLSSIMGDDIRQTLAPVYGLVQRSLFVAWFGWCAVLGVVLWRRPGWPDAGTARR